MTAQTKIRFALVWLFFLTAFVAVIYKSFRLQVMERDFLTGKAQNEVRTYKKLGAVRGEIFDAGGERLAASMDVFSLSADASRIKDKPEAARRLAEILALEPAALLEKLSGDRKFVWLKRRLAPEETAAVEGMGLPGLDLRKEYRRAYPNGNLAANFLGFVGMDDRGLEGLELALDDYLRAGEEKIKVRRDRLGRVMLDSPDGARESRGASVVLTVDRRIQYIAEKALARAVETFKAKGGLALVMRPKTGAVAAAAVWPTFDPNDYRKAPEASRRNRILTDPFEPGSTFKIFVAAAALEENIVSPNTVINCENGAFRVANHTVRDTHSYGDLTVSEIIKYSSNIGSLKIGALLGNDLLYNYLSRFSFGEKTGLAHLPGEAAGLLRHPKNWYAIDAANIAFGQGLTVTALQMVMAMSSLANDGVMMKPYLVDRVLDAEGRVIEEAKPLILRQVVSPLTARQIAAMLRMAVLKGGTGSKAEVPGYPVAGKTGTAQKVVRGAKSYAAGKYVSSFLGFAPYQDPQLCVMVVLDEPANGYYGGSVAAPAFKEIMENALPLLDIPPTEGLGDPVWPLIERNSGGAPGVVAANQPENFIRVKFKKGDRGAKGPIESPFQDELELSPAFAAAPSAAAPSVAASPAAAPPVAVQDAADLGEGNEAALWDLESRETDGVMPDLAGLTMRQVLDVLSEYKLALEFTGSGRAVGQNPAPGAIVAAGSSGAVYFERQ